MAKLSISQAWDESRAVLARDGKLIIPVALALFVLPGIVLDLVMPLLGTRQGAASAGWAVVGIVVLLISLMGQLSVIRLALGPRVTVGDAIAHGARRLIAYFGAVVVWFAPIAIADYFFLKLGAADRAHPSAPAAIGLLVVSLIGIFIAVRMILLSAVASGEEGDSISLLRRAWSLTAGNWWRLFGFILLFGIGALALLWATQLVVGLVARLLFGQFEVLSVPGLLVIIIAQLVSAAVSVLLFVLLARLYAQRAGAAGAHASVPSSGI